MEVTVHHEDILTEEEFIDWCETRDNTEVVLLVNVTGGTSTKTITHRVNVRHCCPKASTSPPVNPPSDTDAPSDVVPGEGPGKRSYRNNQSNHLQRSDFVPFGSAEVHDLCGMRNI
jgi:hypothetical protein